MAPASPQRGHCPVRWIRYGGGQRSAFTYDEVVEVDDRLDEDVGVELAAVAVDLRDAADGEVGRERGACVPR